MRIRLVIFDLDGTLVDSTRGLAAAINHARGVFGLPHFSLSQVREMLEVGRPLVDMAFPGAGLAERERAYAAYLSYSESHLASSAHIHPGVADTLSELKRRGVLMAVVSNKHSRLSCALLRHLGVDMYFSAILGPDCIPCPKPSPGLILKLLDDLGVKASDALIVGDSTSDVLAGKRAGIRTIACTNGHGRAGVEKADYSISSVPELLGLPVFERRRLSQRTRPAA
jgi:phosphoglycolate phosphatase